MLGRAGSLGASGKLPACQHDSMSASAALQANISAEARNLPFVSATGVGFAHVDDVVYLQVRKHTFGWARVVCWPLVKLYRKSDCDLLNDCPTEL